MYGAPVDLKPHRSEVSALLRLNAADISDLGRSFPHRLSPQNILLAIAALDFCFVVCSTLVIATVYQHNVFGYTRFLDIYIYTAAAFGAIVVLFGAIGGHYVLEKLVCEDRAAFGAVKTLHVAFAVFVCLLFFTHLTDVYSRAILMFQYLTILAGLVLLRTVFASVLRHAILARRVQARRVALVGLREANEAYSAKVSPACVLDIVAQCELPSWFVTQPPGSDTATLANRIAGDLAQVLRTSDVDDIILLMPWSAIDQVKMLVQHLSAMPVGVSLVPELPQPCSLAPTVLGLGGQVAIGLSAPPLSAAQIMAKRAFDVCIAALALILLSPLMIAVALLIKADSPGPALFRQRRNGFNQRPFRITKFRTMSVMEDGSLIRQACANDPRVTRVGTWLRRSNIDELPQLFDVLRGDMSLVGPRPHAVAHDREFETTISTYARRHNVKPGVTGWAQVNGCRGPIPSHEKILERVAFDLYYIENFSILFDIRIIVLTIFSKKAYKNAL